MYYELLQQTYNRGLQKQAGVKEILAALKTAVGKSKGTVSDTISSGINHARKATDEAAQFLGENTLRGLRGIYNAAADYGDSVKLLNKLEPEALKKLKHLTEAVKYTNFKKHFNQAGPRTAYDQAFHDAYANVLGKSMLAGGGLLGGGTALYGTDKLYDALTASDEEKEANRLQSTIS